MNQIMELVPAPPALKELALELMKNAPMVDVVVFGAYMYHMDGTIGSYYPELKAVYVDFGNALNDNALYNAGMMFIPNVWYTLIWALAHEVEHACQFELDPGLIKYDKLPQEYEDVAMEAGASIVQEWAEKHVVPGLHDMGWLSKQLIVLLNVMYTKHPEIADEATHVPLGAAARLDTVFALHEFTERGKEVLIEDIDAGKIGIKIGNDRFLTAYEFFGL